MANIGINFNANSVQPAGDSQQLPPSGADGHLVQIINSEMKEINGKAEHGYLELTLEIIEGEFMGQRGSDRLNIHYPSNPQVEEIAHRALSSYCHVTGAMQINDSSALHGIPFRAIVGVQMAKNPEGGAKIPSPEGYTEVKKVRHADGSAPGKGAVGAAGPTPNSAPTTNTPPATNQVEAKPATTGPGWGANNQAQNTEQNTNSGFEQGATTSSPGWKK